MYQIDAVAFALGVLLSGCSQSQSDGGKTASSDAGTPPASTKSSVPTNAFPTMSRIENTQIALNTSTKIPFVIGDVETPIDRLTLNSDTSNSELIPTKNIVFGGNGTNRTVQLTPEPGATGQATITIRVGDGTVKIPNSFEVTVK